MLSRHGGASVILFSALALSELGCGRVPEQALRDEQARTRRYRDAYETLQQEVTALRARVAEGQKSCATGQGAAAGPQAAGATPQ